MAYIVDYALTESATGATSFSANVPPHQPDDYLVVIFSEDASYTLDVPGFTQIGTTQVANAAICTGIFYKKATSSSETITCTSSAADAYAVCVLCIRDADPTTFIDAASTTNSGTTSSSLNTSAAVTTTSSDCLILYVIAKDGIANQAHSNPGVHFLISHDSGGTSATTSACHAVAWYIQRNPGTTPTPTWTCSLAGVTNFATIAIRNKSGGRIPAYVDDSSLPGTTMIMGHHFSTLNNLTFNTSLSIANIGPNGTGKTTVYDAAAATADYGINPYSSALSSTPAATVATSASGFQVTFTNTHDLSNDFIVGTIIAANPKMANYNHGSIVEGGSYLVAADANNYFNSFQIMARDSSPNTEGRSVFSIQPNQTNTRYGYSTNSYDAAATKKLLFLNNCPTATITLYYAEIHRARTHICAGGTEEYPVDSEGLAEIGRSFRVRLIQKTGAAGILSYVPIQIGGGDPINFQIDAGSLQFPILYSPSKKQLNFHADPNKIGISYAGKAGDVIKHTNSVVTSASPYYWSIHENATSEATWDFAGLSVVNAAVTLRPVTVFNGMTFSQAQSITTNGSTVANSVISKCPEIVMNGATFVENTITKSTGTSGAISITGSSEAALQTELNKITSNEFVDNITPLGALRIIYTGPGGSVISLSMSSNTFSNNTADIRWEAPAATRLTINLSGSANASTYSASNSNIVTFVNAKTFSINNVIEGSEVRILRQIDLGELGGAENVGSIPTGLNNVSVDSDTNNPGRYKVTYSYNYSSDLPIFVVVFKEDYGALYLSSSLKSTNDSLTVFQTKDRQYDAGSAP